MFSDSTESISLCLGKFDLWPLNLLQQSEFGCFVSNKMEVCLTKGDDLLVYTCSTSWPTNQLNNGQVLKKIYILGEGGNKYTRLTLLLNFLILAFTEFWLTYVIAMFLNEGSLTATAFVAGKISIFLLEMFMLCYL